MILIMLETMIIKNNDSNGNTDNNDNTNNDDDNCNHDATCKNMMILMMIMIV